MLADVLIVLAGTAAGWALIYACVVLRDRARRSSATGAVSPPIDDGDINEWRKNRDPWA
jgi:hypothetical protein